MKILVDADACPVKDSILNVASKLQLLVVMVADTSHILNYPQNNVITITVDKFADSADFVITNQAEKGDIAVTSDYGLASMLLAKQCFVVHPNGFCYTEDNMDRLLFERHIARELRRQKRGSHHSKKRTKQTNIQFETFFFSVCKKAAMV